MVHAHLLGIIQSQKSIATQEKIVSNSLAGIPMTFDVRDDTDIVIDDRTIDAIIEDAGVDKAYIEELEEQMDGMLTDRAKLDFYDSMESLKSIIVKNVPSGLGYRDFIDRVGKDAIMQDLGLAGEAPYYLETVYRTNYGTAHSVGRWKSAQESSLVTILQYMSVKDGGTTDICLQLDGLTRKKSDPIWKQYYPLNHFS